MSNKSGKIVGRVCCAAGVLCLCAAVGFLGRYFASGNRLAEQSAAIVREMRRLLPEITEGAADAYPGSVAPVMEIDGCDYSYLLEVPESEKTLPVRSRWEDSGMAVSPALYYDDPSEGILMIGGSGRKDQLGCLSQLAPGDLIFLTDMSGVRYAFSVEKMEKTEDLDFEDLSSVKRCVTLFVKDEWDFQYTVVRCKATL